MKNLIKTVIIRILQWEARLILDKYHPKIIGVTGSVGKTSTKDAIYRVLSNSGFSVRKSEKSYNSEIGLPLTILGCQSAWNDLFGWLEIIIYGLRQLFSKKDYPKWLVLEVGLEYPGDIKNVLKWVKFDVAVTTLLPEVPVHMELFASKEDVINEKMLLPKSVTAEGIVLLNADDQNALKFVPEIQAEIFTYGQSDEADYRAGLGQTYYEEREGYKLPTGLEFSLYNNEKELRVRIPGVVGNHQIYPILAALALGEKLGLNMVEMADSFSGYLPPAGRLSLLEGIKDTIILDDTYNASPVAMSAGLVALESFQTTGRKIAVMGDMLQLGGMTVEAHKKIGYQAAEFCDLVITVGLRSRFIDDALVERKFHKRRIRHFDNSIEAGKFLQSKLQPGDVIFVKGSQLTRMEKVVEEVMAHPELKDKLLVRQDKEWSKR